MHKFLVCTYCFFFAQTQENFALLQDRETVTFRNSVSNMSEVRSEHKVCFGAS